MSLFKKIINRVKELNHLTHGEIICKFNEHSEILKKIVDTGLLYAENDIYYFVNNYIVCESKTYRIPLTDVDSIKDVIDYYSLVSHEPMSNKELVCLLQ